MVKEFFSATTALLIASAALLSSCSDDDNKQTPPPPEDPGLTMINTTKVLYYGDRQTTGVYNYFFGLCDAEFIKDEQGDDAAPEGGHLVFFDVYSSAGADSFETAVLPNGTYVLSADKKAGSMNNYYTRLQIWKEDKQVSVDFKTGTLVVEESSKGKLLRAEFELASGETLKCTYEGPLVFGDPDAGSDAGIPALKEPVNTDFVWAGGIYYGDEYGTGTDRFQISFTDVPLNADGMMSEAGYNVILSVYAKANESFITLEPGTYVVNDTYAAGTIEPGEFIMDYIGSLCVKVDDQAEAVGLSLISGGNVKISYSGMGYKVEFDLTTPEGISVKGVYDGEIEFDDQSSGGGESNTTLEGDYTLDLTKAVAEVTYYGDFYGNGKANWLLSLVDSKGDTIDIDLITEPTSTTYIPLPESGQYNMSVDYGIGCVPGENNAFGMVGTWYMDMSTIDAAGYIYGYAAAIDGNVKLSKTGDTYTVKFEFVDENWNLFDGEWSGTFPSATDGTQLLSNTKKPASVLRKPVAKKASVKITDTAKTYGLPVSGKARIR